MGRALATAPKLWRPRTPDSRDVAVLAALHSARLLTVPQLQRLYGLESAGSVHPRLTGLLGPDGTPRILERERGPDGRYYYALGRVGYRYLPETDPPPVRHKALAQMRLSPQWIDHTLAVGWLMVPWLTSEGDWQPEGSPLSWWGEHRAILPYPLPRPRGPVTHGRVEPDGAMRLTRPDGAAWTGAVEHDAGSEDSADWAAKLKRWAAVIRCGSWRTRFGDTQPHLLITVPTAARRAQIAPWVAAGRKEHNNFWAWIAVHREVRVGEEDPIDAACARLVALAWLQVTATPAAPLQTDAATLPAIIAAIAPWRPAARTSAASLAPADGASHAQVALEARVQEQTTQLQAQAATIQGLQAAVAAQRERWAAARADLVLLDQHHQRLQTTYQQLWPCSPPCDCNAIGPRAIRCCWRGGHWPSPRGCSPWGCC